MDKMNTPMQWMVRKLKANIPKIQGIFISPEKAKELLTQAAQVASAQAFEWVLVDRPQDGTLFICHATSEQSKQFSVDGYGWLDEETVAKSLVDGMEVEVRDRMLGFETGERHASIKRRRIRILQPGVSELFLIHYLKLDSKESQTQVTTNHIKIQPRALPTNITQRAAAVAASTATSASVPLPQKATPPSVGKPVSTQFTMYQPPNAPPVQTTPSTRGRKPKNQNNNMQVKVVENEFVGDELDLMLDSIVAVERFRRNQEYMEEIFSSYPAYSITPPAIVDTTPAFLENLKKQKEELSKEIEELRNRTEHQKSEFLKHKSLLNQAIHHLKHGNTIEELDHQSNQLAQSLHKVIVEPLPSVSKREITNG